MSENDENLSSLLFVQSNSDQNSNIYSITNDQLFDIVHNNEISIKTRETILIQFLYFDYLSFGEREYGNIPLDLFSFIKVKKNQNYKQFKINEIGNSSSLTSKQVSDICITFSACDGRCQGACDECPSCSPTSCYSLGGFSNDPGGSAGGGGSGGGGNSNAPWYLMNPDIDIYSYNSKIRSVFKNLTDYDVILQQEQLDYLKNNVTILNDLTALLVNNTREKSEFTYNVLSALNDGAITTYKQFIIAVDNFKYSLKSPYNVDLTSILENPTLPENAKFISIYDALTTSTEFQKLFISTFGSMFDGNYRHNVKFELVNALYDENDPTKEINGNTTYDPNLPYILIKINKKKLNDSSIKQTRIENARTIIHEFIHAYLLAISNNAIVGPTDIPSLLNKKYTIIKEQHDFMYNNMLPTITKILTESRDFLTYPAGRIEVESLTVNTKKDQSTSEIWNWKHYFESISLEGLSEATSYASDFPAGSDALNTLELYVKYGRTWLDKKN